MPQHNMKHDAHIGDGISLLVLERRERAAGHTGGAVKHKVRRTLYVHWQRRSHVGVHATLYQNTTAYG